MVFHEIESITDVRSSHRTIIYYLENKADKFHEPKLSKSLESAMDMLEKKNDDLLIIKVSHSSGDFTKFQDLYRAEVLGPVTLFAVNNEGIPIINMHVFKEEDIYVVLEAICKSCMLNNISPIEIAKKNVGLACSITNSLKPVGNDSEPILATLSSPQSKESVDLQKNTPQNKASLASSQNKIEDSPSQIETERLPHQSESTITSETTHHDCRPTTQLQIRLPDGSRDQQQFNNDALLNEVWVFISTKYKLKDFDLKTYNHQAFSEEEYEKSLKDLDLYPNGVIIVVPKNVVPYNNNNYGLSNMVRYGFSQLMNRTTNVFHFVQGLLIMVWNSLFFSNNRQPTNSREKSLKTSKDGSSSGQSSQKRSDKPLSNIHTLKREDDSDDENNRYNGNSTQQK